MPQQRSLSTRTMDVLAAFTADNPHLSLSDISRRAGLSLTTTHRIVADLAGWGALERGPDGRYDVGLRLFETAALAQRGPALREIALPYLEDLYEATHENVQLAVREGLEVVYIERIAGRDAVPVLTRVGGRFALHATGVGLVLLAFAPREIQERVLSEPLTTWTTQTISDPATLRATLADVRRSDHAVSRGQVTLDALSLACPVRGSDDEVVAAVSVVVQIDTDPRGLLPALRAASRSISRALGSPRARRSDARPPDA
ncbi:IclR family transcriptional regulator [Allobranchiibius huperziae]|uniref:DNA-binding IclR family transcriptional regulator n=1 Tax=Allobranchiibius huperziae TaxID=1874116 RepID=A0A853DCJ7_9MICO|nr:IclR family transcriptional regulator [Allobranchiibius huperziae]NYJ74307.1 DNA-binding IclR family transcriptional regulator [Allobranchiibius huperziae]